jgi:mono/diheme cytochrome c family protein
VVDGGGAAFSVPGLWGLAFGNDTNNQPRTTLFYAAGTNGEVNGVVGRIDVGATPPVLNEPPVVTVTAPSGTVSGTRTITATATSDTSIARVEFFVGGTTLGTVTTTPYSIEWDTTTRADGTVDLTATATDTSGNVGTSPAVTVTVQNAAATVTLTQLQSGVFTPRCSGCHDGSAPPGGALPGSMNLTAGNSHASLVNVASQEKPALMRVKPGEPGNSYLVHKLEGGPAIEGARMPFGGPFLDQATIDDVRAWIASGAAND